METFRCRECVFDKNLEVRLNVDYASDYRYKKDFKDFNMIDKLPEMDPDKNDFIAEAKSKLLHQICRFSVNTGIVCSIMTPLKVIPKIIYIRSQVFRLKNMGLMQVLIKIDYL